MVDGYSSDKAVVDVTDHMLAIRDRRTLTDKVDHALREMILSGELDNGEKIVIERTARLLAVSATPVREALARLVSEGLVLNEGHRGYTVTAMWDAKTFDQMQEARMVVEPYAARVAARLVRERSAAGLIDELEYHLGQMLALIGDSRLQTSTLDACQQYARSDSRFHQAIVDACVNTPLSEMLRRLRLQPHLTRLYCETGNPPDAAAEHEEIVRRIREGSEELAGKAMEHHLSRSDERLRQFAVHGGTQTLSQPLPAS
jgi:DNA-binding GntR family transcriptional regulator